MLEFDWPSATRHIANISAKLGFTSRVQIALWVVTGDGRAGGL